MLMDSEGIREKARAEADSLPCLQTALYWQGRLVMSLNGRESKRGLQISFYHLLCAVKLYGFEV
jgi:hypothetical protein